MNHKTDTTEKRNTLSLLIQAVCAAWLLCSHIFGGAVYIGDVAHSARVSLLLYLGMLLLGTALFFLLGQWKPGMLRLSLGVCCFLTAIFWAMAAGNHWLTLGLGALTLGGCMMFRDRFPVWEPEARLVRRSYWICGIVLALFIGAVTVCRYLTFCAPGFDFGIFAQMFASMKRTGLPVTTYERSKVLSHFNVHFSPIYYLMLPFYWLFPNPATLQIEQALVVAAGLWPLYLLCKRHGLSNGATCLLAGLYLLFPALSGGCFYDLHENCFLTVCLLFVLYGMDANKNWILWLFAGLTLCIKEDAGIYLAFVGLYYLLSRLHPKKGVALLGVSVLVFFLTTSYVFAHGDGVIQSRFSNLVPGKDDGMLAVVRTALVHPGYLLKACFTAEKVQYLLFMLLPFGTLLLARKHPARYLLLGPMLLLNVLPDYKYQYTIDFQYNFGSTALLFYFAVLQLGELNRRRQWTNVMAGLLACTVLFCGTKLGKLQYVFNYLAQPQRYAQMEQALKQIPADASVAASSGLVAHLAEHEALYPDEEVGIRTDYVALDLRGKREAPELEGYTIVYESVDLAIYARQTAD